MFGNFHMASPSGWRIQLWGFWEPVETWSHTDIQTGAHMQDSSVYSGFLHHQNMHIRLIPLSVPLTEALTQILSLSSGAVAAHCSLRTGQMQSTSFIVLYIIGYVTLIQILQGSVEVESML